MKKNKLFPTYILIILVIVFSFFVFNGCKTNQNTSLVAQAEIILVSPEEANEIISENGDIIVLDVRTPEEYREGHLENAWLIPVDDLEGRLNELPRDKAIIVYCRSGVRSNRAANILVENDFSEVYDMGGILDWQEKGFPVIIEDKAEILEFETITVDDAYGIFLNNQDYLFIDVRSKDEYENGHIQGAVNIPVSEIEDRLGEIPGDRTLIVYCNGSGCDRSGRAATILLENGYNEVYDLIGNGISEWEEKGYPVEEGN